MAIRITGMYSGLDTESIINELASAQSYKKNKLVKEQKRLSWKQDAWKSLNTKIYSFYQKLDDLRLQSSYMKKKTTVSNPSAIKVVSGELEGSHSVSVSKLSKRATLTSGRLDTETTGFLESATLGQLGYTAGTGSISVNGALGQEVEIEVNENMTIGEFIGKIKETGLNANYDEDNQRIYISSRDSGSSANFFLTANDAKGLEALNSLKLLSKEDIQNSVGANGVYTKWASYIDGAGNYTDEYKKVINDEVLARLETYKEQTDKLKARNDLIKEANTGNLKMLKEIQANAEGKYNDYQTYITASGYNSAWTLDNAADVNAAGKKLYDYIYGEEKTQKVQARNEDGSLKYEDDGITPVYVQAKNEDGSPKYEDDGTTPVYETETVRTGGMAGDLETLQTTLSEKQEALKAARKALEEKQAAGGDTTAEEAAVATAETDVTAASEAVTRKQDEIGKALEVYSFYDAFEKNDKEKTTNDQTITDNEKLYTYDDATKTFKEKNEAGAEVEIGEGLVAKDVKEKFDAKVQQAKDMIANSAAYAVNAAGTKIDGQNAEIYVDNVLYTSSDDTITVNGLTLTALEKTDEGKEVTLTTATDTDGVYDMIKGFIKAYSELINEMDSLYNAESAKGYDPLLAEEKEALTDTEIEEWEKKIKDSLLRRDNTLGDVASAMKMDMLKGFNIGGQMIYLSDFGIATLGYFNAPDNERNAYHIDGDEDDAKTKSKNNMLKNLISTNPEAVMDFFTNLTDTLHNTLADKMSATKLSSALTFYNDKKMKEDYDDYTSKIKKQEEKLNDYMDKWYAKFSAMETALAKLESKNSSLSSLFGG